MWWVLRTRMKSGSRLPRRLTPPSSLKAKVFRSAYQIRPPVRRCDRSKRLRAKIRNPVQLGWISVFSSMGLPKNQWIKVNLEGVKSNGSALGARVIAHCEGKKQARAVVSQSSYYSCNDPRLHFGLGPVRVADIEVFRLNGLHEIHKSLPANQLITLLEGAGQVANKGWSKI
jgi:ASPIC and UnbV